MTTNGRKPDVPRVIRAGELYTLREAERRLNWGRKTTSRAMREGLQAVAYGREKYLRGATILAWFEGLEREQSKAD